MTDEDTPTLTPFGPMVKKLREDLGIPLRQVARQINVSHVFLHLVEKGQKPLPWRHLEPLCVALAADYQELEKVLTEDRKSRSAVASRHDHLELNLVSAEVVRLKNEVEKLEDSNEQLQYRMGKLEDLVDELQSCGGAGGSK